MKETKMREYLNSIRKPETVKGKCLIAVSGIPSGTFLCVRIGNKQHYQRFGAIRSRCYTQHKEFKNVEDFPKTLPMLLELDMSTTRDDIAEMVPLWMLRDVGVCKIEFTMILHPSDAKSDIQDCHVIALREIRFKHHHNCAVAASTAARTATEKDLKAKNAATRQCISDMKKEAKAGPRDLTEAELQIKVMTKEEINAQVSKSGDDAFANFKSMHNVSQMVVVRDGESRVCYFNVVLATALVRFCHTLHTCRLTLHVPV